jgi:hypothetical protein
MSRERYREVLRHLWLRGIKTMQVFNALLPGYEEMAVFEVQDAAAIYDEMLELREFLEDGEVLNVAVPKIQDSGVVWSGLRLGIAPSFGRSSKAEARAKSWWKHGQRSACD